MMAHSLLPTLLSVLMGCTGAKEAAPAPAAPAPVAAAPAPAAAAPVAGVHDCRDGDRVAALDEATLRADPMAVLRMPGAPLEDVGAVLGWMAINPEVYDYLPASIQEDPAVSAAAVAAGYTRGVVLTGEVTARAAPRNDAPAAKLPCDTTNGYITGPREEQHHTAGERLAILETVEGEGGPWYRITAGEESSPEEDRKTFEMCDNLGGVPLEEFTLARDPGWIPAAVTAPAVVAPRCRSELLTFEGADNGDLAVYVRFQEVSFADFGEAAYTILSAAEAGTLSPGERLRVIWCDEAMVWLPL